MDLIIRNSAIVTASDTIQADVGIEGGQVKQIGQGLGPAAREIDASGKYLFPGGVEVHTHVDFELLGNKTEQSFQSGKHLQVLPSPAHRDTEKPFPQPDKIVARANQEFALRQFVGQVLRRHTLS